MFGKWEILVVLGLLLVCSALVGANEGVATDPSTAPSLQSASANSAQPLRTDELQTLQMSADSLAQDSPLQQMAVGAEINTTIVLSVLVALIIFAVLVMVL